MNEDEVGPVPKPGDLVEITKPYYARVVRVDLEDGTMVTHGHPAQLQIDGSGWDFVPKIDDAPSRCIMCGYPMMTDVRPYRCRFGDETDTVEIAARWCTECPEAYLNGVAIQHIDALHEKLRERYDAKIRASVCAHLPGYARQAKQTAEAIEHLVRHWLGHQTYAGAKEHAMNYARDLRALAEAIESGVKMPGRGYAGDEDA